MKKTEETKKNKPADEAVQAPYVPASVILFGNEHDPLTENEEAQAGKDEEKFHEDEEKPDDDEETFDDGGDDVFDPWKDDDEDEVDGIGQAEAPAQEVDLRAVEVQVGHARHNGDDQIDQALFVPPLGVWGRR